MKISSQLGLDAPRKPGGTCTVPQRSRVSAYSFNATLLASCARSHAAKYEPLANLHARHVRAMASVQAFDNPSLNNNDLVALAICVTPCLGGWA